MIPIEVTSVIIPVVVVVVVVVGGFLLDVLLDPEHIPRLDVGQGLAGQIGDLPPATVATTLNIRVDEARHYSLQGIDRML